MIIKTEYPKRNDEEDARRWRGPVFPKYDQFQVGWPVGPSYEWFRAPNSVTFPICEFCRHVIWDWPHFEEEVPKNVLCSACAREEEQAQERDGWL